MIFYNGCRDIIATPTKHTISLVSCGTVNNKNTATNTTKEHLTIREHGRKDWSLFFCTKGKIEFGRENPIVVHENEAFIYPPEVYQYYYVDEEETLYYFCHFTGSCVEEVLESLGLLTEQKFRPSKDFDANQFSKLKRLYELHDGQDIDCEWRMLRLLSSLSNPTPKKEERNIFSALLEEMENHYFEPFHPDAYAAKLGISVSRFTHLFKDIVGESPLHYYTSIRIANAARLLKYTNFTIQKVANSVGYDDPLYFDRVFRKWMGLSPKGFRKEQE